MRARHDRDGTLAGVPGEEERVLIPGDPERLTRRQRLQDGIALPAATWRAFRGAAESVGVHVEP